MAITITRQLDEVHSTGLFEPDGEPKTRVYPRGVVIEDDREGTTINFCTNKIIDFILNVIKDDDPPLLSEICRDALTPIEYEQFCVMNDISHPTIPTWIRSMAKLLEIIGVRYQLTSSNGFVCDEIHCLHIPEKQYASVLQQAHFLGVIFKIHHSESAFYEGDEMNPGEYIDSQQNGISFVILENTMGLPTDEIYETREVNQVFHGRLFE